MLFLVKSDLKEKNILPFAKMKLGQNYKSFAFCEHEYFLGKNTRFQKGVPDLLLSVIRYEAN
jgi:hypothetical protein